jgi:hypothetical protein
MHKALRLTLVVPALFLTIACGGAPDDAGTTSDTESSLTDATVDPVIADALSGGDFRCTEQARDFRHNGSVLIHLEPARWWGNAWHASTTLTGSYYIHPYGADDGAFDVRLGRNREVTGGRSIYSGDVGHGYYCGGAGSATCGADRDDAIRLYAVDGVLHCEVDVKRDEPWQDHVTYSIRDTPTREDDACFDEEWYLAQNPDVADAVAAGAFLTGRHHYALHGRSEGRQACP